VSDVPALVAIESAPSAVHQFDQELVAAITKVVEAGVPQAYVVALLHAHALQQTQRVIDEA
jgi:hypothetical protein